MKGFRETMRALIRWATPSVVRPQDAQDVQAADAERAARHAQLQKLADQRARQREILDRQIRGTIARLKVKQ